MKKLIIIALLGLMTTNADAVEYNGEVECGRSISDWCPSTVKYDTCSKHKDKASCKADPKCYGVPFKGESAAPCKYDSRGFGENCPTVGCTALKP